MTAKIDDILLGKDASHPLTITLGYEWYDTVYSVNDMLHETGSAALLADIQNLSSRISNGEVVADLMRSAAHDMNIGEAELARFGDRLLDTIFRALPGHYLHEREEDEAPLDVSLMLNVYGSVCADLPATRRAHVLDADVQAGKEAVFGDTRSRIEKFTDRVKEAVNSLMGDPATSGLYIDDVAVAALTTIKRYTDLVESGDLHISNDRGISVFQTMAKIKTCLDIYCPEYLWSDEAYTTLRTFDDTMIGFQKAVVARLPEPEAPQRTVGI